MFAQYINEDCQNIILSKLPYLDMLNYKMTNKSNYQSVILNFRERFIQKLLQCQVVPSFQLANQFCDKLYETGAKIAGSFVLDVLYDKCDSSDIDIYDSTLFRNQSIYEYGEDYTVGYKIDDFFKEFEDNHRLKFTQFLYQAGFLSLGFHTGPDVIFRSFAHQSLWPGIKERFRIIDIYDTPHHNLRGEDISQIKHRIQIIPIAMEVKEGEKNFIPRFIKATFDLEICQNYFDGKNVYIKNYDKLVKKYDYIKSNSKFIFSIYQSEKDKSEESTMKRMSKYTERGFKISLHPQYNQMKQEIDDIIDKEYKHGRHYDIFKHIANGEIDLSKYDEI